jgi:hypothetical protein
VASFNQIVKYLFAKEDAKLLHPMYVGTTTYQLILKKKKKTYQLNLSLLLQIDPWFCVPSSLLQRLCKLVLAS